MKFTVVLHTDDGQRYGATVPDLPGCYSARDSFDEALKSVVEAIDLHAETGLIRHFEPYPNGIASDAAPPPCSPTKPASIASTSSKP